MADLDRDQKAILYVIGAIDELRGKGLVSMEGERLQPGGRKVYEDLKASGFEPTREEVSQTVAFLKSRGAMGSVTKLGERVDRLCFPGQWRCGRCGCEDCQVDYCKRIAPDGSRGIQR